MEAVQSSEACFRLLRLCSKNAEKLFHVMTRLEDRNKIKREYEGCFNDNTLIKNKQTKQRQKQDKLPNNDLDPDRDTNPGIFETAYSVFITIGTETASF